MIPEENRPRTTLLSSLLLAVLVYLCVIGAVLYGYRYFRVSWGATETSTPVAIAIDRIGTSGEKEKRPALAKSQQSPKHAQPVATKSVTKQKSNHKRSKPKVIPKPAPKTVRHTTPQAAPEQPTSPAKAVPTSPLPLPKELPVHIAPPQHHIPPAPLASPERTLALKEAPVENREITPQHQSPAKTTRKKVRKKSKKPPSKKKHIRGTQRRKSSRATRGSGASHRRAGGRSKSQFLSRLKARINRHKHYPRAAQRMGITGRVTLRFTILRSGAVGAISASGPKPLRSASVRALKQAFPVSTSRVPFALPYSTGVTIRYE